MQSAGRWEWRAFGPRAEQAAAALAGLEPDRVERSTETYVLSRTSRESVKVRAGLIDVKRLLAVDGEGLELWTPVLKAPFPLTGEDLTVVLASLAVSAPEPTRPSYSLDEVLDEIVRPCRDLRAVVVEKTRRRLDFADCAAELTEIRAEERTLQTVAIESEDASRVVRAVRELGVRPLPNVCVPRALKMTFGLAAPRYAVVDVGTNSVKFHLAERRPDGSWLTVADRAEVTRLGEGLDRAGTLGSEPIARTVDAVAAIIDEARESGAEEIAAVGTAGLRIADNSSVFLDEVGRRTGVVVEVIPGEEESRLAYLGVLAGLETPAGSLVVFDTGGGSSQFTFGRDGGVEERFSVNVGAARFTERFGLDAPVPEEALAAVMDAIADDLRRLDDRPVPDALVGMGGAVTNLAAVMHRLETYDPEVVRGAELDAAEVDRQIELYRVSTAEERRRVVGLQPKRAEVILAGACIVRTVMRRLGCASLVVSDRGLRHGLLLERFGS